MLDKLKQVEDRYEELCARAEQPDFYADPKKAAAWLREQKELAPIVAAYRAYCAAQRDMQDAAELMAGQADAELKALCQEELTGAKKRAAALEQELRVLLLPHDPNDGKNVILEIRPGVGGEESALFAHSLFRMYSLYAAARGWTVELLNYNETELGGIKEADFMICGAGAYSRLKFESGVHRVQRVPETESGGRVHTSTSCRRWRRPMSTSGRRTSRCRSIARPARAASTSTRPRPPCALSISRPASSWPVRRSAASSRTASAV